MNHEHLRVQYSCSTCAYFDPNEDPEETKGTCHVRSSSEDKFPERDSAVDWCGDHTTVEPGCITPDVVRMLVPEAKATIEAVGSLDVGTITRVEDLEEPRDKVIAQNPIGGTPVAAHSKVKLTAINK